MTSKVPREKVHKRSITYPPKHQAGNQSKIVSPSITEDLGTSTSILWQSEGNPVNRRTGIREGGGNFHVTHSGLFVEPGSVSGIVNNLDWIYSGPVVGSFIKPAIHTEHYSNSAAKDKDLSVLNSDGATAIAQCAPTNPTANLSVSLAETFKEGVPSLFGIQSWKQKTGFLKSLGSEYLNYQFGWAPLKAEVDAVVNAARNHRDIMQNYRHNEGRDVHREFHFPVESQQWEFENSRANAIAWSGGSKFQSLAQPAAQCVSYVRNERKRWFEGCFTYGGPGKADNYSRHLGFGSEADAVFGLNLNPSVLWELTPWSWAVDWFTNAGDVISNVSNFAAAGLVMRYGFMMEENISESYTQYGDSAWNAYKTGESGTKTTKREGATRIGHRTVTKSRAPANPFGFGVGWEGLSPTQLAITAAIGITRFL